MANRWVNNENSERLYFGGSKITADVNCTADCNNEIKRHLLLGRKAMTKIDSGCKSRAITLLTKVSIVRAMVYPVCMDVTVGP